MMHCNGHQLCSLWIDVTGEYGDIVRICIMPLDNFLKPANDVIAFYHEMKPIDIDKIDFETADLSRSKLQELRTTGIDPWMARDYFEDWYKTLQLKPNKRIMPLTHDWPTKRPFLEKWLGELNFRHYFDIQYRDVMCFGTILNDYDNQHGRRDYRHAKVDLPFLGNCHQVEVGQKSDIIYKCEALSRIYRGMLQICSSDFPISC